MKGVWVGVALVVATFAPAQGLKSDFQRFYDGLARASARRDSKRVTGLLERLVTAEFQFVPLTGASQPRGDYLKSIQSGFKEVDHVNAYSFRVLMVRERENEAVVLLSSKVDALMKRPGGVRQRIQREASRQDLWVRTKGGWRLSEIRETASKIWVDGKLVSS